MKKIALLKEIEIVEQEPSNYYGQVHDNQLQI